LTCVAPHARAKTPAIWFRISQKKFALNQTEQLYVTLRLTMAGTYAPWLCLSCLLPLPLASIVDRVLMALQLVLTTVPLCGCTLMHRRTSFDRAVPFTGADIM
jgi:hypothetical protein